MKNLPIYTSFSMSPYKSIKHSPPHEIISDLKILEDEIQKELNKLKDIFK